MATIYKPFLLYLAFITLTLPFPSLFSPHFFPPFPTHLSPPSLPTPHAYNMPIQLLYRPVLHYTQHSSGAGFATRDDAYDVMSGLHHKAEL